MATRGIVIARAAADYLVNISYAGKVAELTTKEYNELGPKYRSTRLILAFGTWKRAISAVAKQVDTIRKQFGIAVPDSKDTSSDTADMSKDTSSDTADAAKDAAQAKAKVTQPPEQPKPPVAKKAAPAAPKAAK